jgi:hypothetical protein
VVVAKYLKQNLSTVQSIAARNAIILNGKPFPNFQIFISFNHISYSDCVSGMRGTVGKPILLKRIESTSHRKTPIRRGRVTHRLEYLYNNLCSKIAHFFGVQLRLPDLEKHSQIG